MLPPWRSLCLANAPAPVYLVDALEATDLRRHGYEPLPWSEATWFVDRCSAFDELRSFAWQVGLGDAAALRRTRDTALLRAISDKVARGDLVVVRETGRKAQANDQKPDEEGMLLRDLARELKGGALRLENQTYEIIAGHRFGGQTTRSDYRALKPQEAQALLARAQKAPGVSERLSGLLGKAATLLAPAWHPFETPKGLVVLRFELTRSYASNEDLPMTPAALKAALRPPVDLEVVVLDHRGKAVKCKFKLVLPDGEIMQGKLDGAGKAIAKTPEPGTCKVTLLEPEAA